MVCPGHLERRCRTLLGDTVRGAHSMEIKCPMRLKIFSHHGNRTEWASLPSGYWQRLKMWYCLKLQYLSLKSTNNSLLQLDGFSVFYPVPNLPNPNQHLPQQIPALQTSPFLYRHLQGNVIIEMKHTSWTSRAIPNASYESLLQCTHMPSSFYRWEESSSFGWGVEFNGGTCAYQV